MKRTAINLHTTLTGAVADARDLVRREGQRGSITVEHIMWAVVIVALVTAVGALLTAWATGKIGELG